MQGPQRGQRVYFFNNSPPGGAIRTIQYFENGMEKDIKTYDETGKTLTEAEIKEMNEKAIDDVIKAFEAVKKMNDKRK